MENIKERGIGGCGKVDACRERYRRGSLRVREPGKGGEIEEGGEGGQWMRMGWTALNRLRPPTPGPGDPS
jgi:hypothetical protein